MPRPFRFIVRKQLIEAGDLCWLDRLACYERSVKCSKGGETESC